MGLEESQQADTATESFFFALDNLCDVLIVQMNEQEYFRIASPKERFLMMHRMVQVAVTKWFHQIAGEIEPTMGLTPREEKAWVQTLKATKEEGRKE